MKTKQVRCVAWIAAITFAACGGDDTTDPDAGPLDATASRDGGVDAGTDTGLDGGDDAGLDAGDDGGDSGPPPPPPYYLLTNSRSDPSEYYRLDEAGGPPVSLGGEPDFSPGLMTFDRANGVLYAITGVLGEGYELHRVDLCDRTHEVVGMLTTSGVAGMPARIVEGFSWRESTGELWLAFGFEVGFDSDVLAVVDPDTGALDVVASISGTLQNELDHMMWGNDGILYGRDGNGIDINRFYSVDPVTGSASLIGELGVRGGVMAQNPDTGFVAFANSSAALASLDLTDASSTEIVEVYEELMGRDLVYVNTVCPDP